MKGYTCVAVFFLLIKSFEFRASYTTAHNNYVKALSQTYEIYYMDQNKSTWDVIYYSSVIPLNGSHLGHVWIGCKYLRG